VLDRHILESGLEPATPGSHMANPAFGSLDWYLGVADTIREIYKSELNREPEPAGLFNWIFHAREEGKDGAWILEQVKQSPEWHAIHDPRPVPTIPAYSREALLTFRGALNIKMNAPFGLRPNQDNNTASTNGLWNYAEADQDRILAAYKTRGYTHGPAGPFIDPGYHDLWPGVDFRDPAQLARVEAAIEKIYAAGITPVIFITPDGWTVDQLRALEPIFRSAKWQTYCQLVVNGFEQQGSKYGWSNAKYVSYGKWLNDVFPKAVIGLHTISKIEAPVGEGDDTSKPGMDIASCWRRVADVFDYWLYQDDMWDHPEHVDPANPDGRTDLEHFVSLWDKNDPNSFVRRFGPGGLWECSLIPIPGEYCSYGLVWQDQPESFAREVGRRCIAAGAVGAFDGC
jgi:hypothetical protein